MKVGTKLGWALVAISIVLSAWVIMSRTNMAATENGFTTDDSGVLTVIPEPDSSGSITIPSTVDTDTVKSISSSLTYSGDKDDFISITLPSTLESASPSNFSQFHSLKTLSISGSSKYHVSDGCLYEGTTLIYAPEGKQTINIEDGTTAIGTDAFLNSSITSVTIPASVVSIGDQTNSNWTSANKLTVISDFGSAAYEWAVNHSEYVEWLPSGSVVGNTYYVYYEGNGATGGSTATQSFNEGGSVNISTNAYTRTGYTFNGWNTAADGSGTSYSAGDPYSDDADLTLYAQWAEGGSYTITFNANGGSGTMATQTVAAGNTATLNSNQFTRSGYTFTGWNTAANGSGTSYTDGGSITPTNDITLYAQWGTGANYTVTYIGNGATGGSTAAQTFTSGNSVSIRSNGFTRTGYTFAGWNTMANGSGTAYAVGQTYNTEANLTLYAQWVSGVTNYTVTYNGNGNTGGSTAAQSFAPGGSVSIRENGFTRTGYTFSGWNTAANGTGTAYTPGQTYSAASNLTLYAQWTTNGSASGASGTTSTTTTTTTTGTGSNGTTSNTGSTGTTHTKDATPATADGDIDPRLVLCVGIAALGVAIIIGSNRRKLTYIRGKRDISED